MKYSSLDYMAWKSLHQSLTHYLVELKIKMMYEVSIIGLHSTKKSGQSLTYHPVEPEIEIAHKMSISGLHGMKGSGLEPDIPSCGA
jgi:hypothetical protein